MTSGQDIHDLLIIGGGINGCGIACDAAGRRLGVVLVEQDDLASATSSASSKLIHGGLRYLEYYQFRLVREALAEREVLLGKAPHIIRPLRFVLPHQNQVRPAWMIRLGLFLYDHLAPHQQLPDSEGVDLSTHAWGAPLTKSNRRGFAYSDCWADDARLVVLNAMQAAEKGATILTRTRLLEAERQQEHWQATVEDRRTGETKTIKAHAIINAAGPWVEEVLSGRLGVTGKRKIRLVKGSHIVVPKMYDGDHAYILQLADKRVVFAMPFETGFTLIGTTDLSWQGAPAGEPEPTANEVTYLCDAVNGFFEKSVSADDVVWSFSGVRPLFDDRSGNPSAVTRDYVLDLDASGPPLLSVFGGKITTYRRLAEHALDQLKTFLPGMRGSWTADASLPGGDIPSGDFAAFTAAMTSRYDNLDTATVASICRRHGSHIPDVLGDGKNTGQDFGGGLFSCEIDYLIDHEWAITAEDVLWRRTKAGLHMTGDERKAVETYMMQKS
ncbi:MAG: glycerol-3-phosphate dehydrogenase [Rhodospirillales bacterium]